MTALLMNDEIIDPSEWEDLPRTDTEFRRRVWVKLLSIEKQTVATNGRVTDLERFKWLLVGGVGVLTVLVVPLFLSVVTR